MANARLNRFWISFGRWDYVLKINNSDQRG